MVELLLKYKPEFFASSYEMKIIPINIAVMRNKERLVDLLMQYGADFSYESYISSNANLYNNWDYVTKEVKKTIAKHKCKLIILLLILILINI